MDIKKLLLKALKLFSLKKKTEIITTKELAEIITNYGAIPIPDYNKNNDRRFIAEARSIRVNQNAKRVRVKL